MSRILMLICLLAVAGCDSLTAPSDHSDYSGATMPAAHGESSPIERRDSMAARASIPDMGPEAPLNDEELCLP